MDIDLNCRGRVAPVFAEDQKFYTPSFAANSSHSKPVPPGLIGDSASKRAAATLKTLQLEPSRPGLVARPKPPARPLSGAA